MIPSYHSTLHTTPTSITYWTISYCTIPYCTTSYCTILHIYDTVPNHTTLMFLDKYLKIVSHYHLDGRCVTPTKEFRTLSITPRGRRHSPTQGQAKHLGEYQKQKQRGLQCIRGVAINNVVQEPSFNICSFLNIFEGLLLVR